MGVATSSDWSRRLFRNAQQQAELLALAKKLEAAETEVQSATQAAVTYAQSVVADDAAKVTQAKQFLAR